MENELPENYPSNRWAPLTWSQEAIWYQSESEPENFQSGFNVSIVIADLDVPFDAVRIAVDKLVMRYETLRTTLLRLTDDRVVQQIHDFSPVDITMYNIKSAEHSDRTVTQAALKEMYSPSFNLYADLPVRFGVVMNKAGLVYSLMIVLHHIAIDYWGLKLLKEEFIRQLRLNAYANRKPAASSSKAVLQPREVAWLEADDVMRKRSERSVKYWREWFGSAPVRMFSKLADEVPAPRFRTGKVQSFEMDSAMRQIAAYFRVTKPSVYLALYTSFISIISGLPLVVLRMETSSRDKQLSRTIGCLFHHSMVSVDVPEGMLFGDVLRRTAAASLTAQRRARCSYLAKKEAELSIARSRGINFGFDVSFNYLGYPGPLNSDLSSQLESGKIRWLSTAQNTNLDLACEIDPASKTVAVTSDTAIVREEVITQLLKGFIEVPEYLIKNPSASVAEIAVQTGLRSPLMDDSWLIAEGSWVNIRDIEALIESYPPVVSCHIRIDGSSHPGSHIALIAEIITDYPEIAPRVIHQFVSSRLSSTRTVIAPHWYEIYAVPVSAATSSRPRRQLTNSGSGRE